LKRLCVLLILVWNLASVSFAQGTAPSSSKEPLTIESIFAEGGITGRDPEAVQWSPDGKKLTYVMRDDAGEHGQLWYVDTASGEKKVLVSEAKLASLAPDANKIKDEREKERVTRYHVAAYVWSPDSKYLLFDSNGQLWIYNLENGVGVHRRMRARTRNSLRTAITSPSSASTISTCNRWLRRTGASLPTIPTRTS
jgi:dipeptidyl aminopeptidase/acylaminoacyl peptidase